MIHFLGCSYIDVVFLILSQSSCAQPLHVGFTSDAGGNTILVRWYRRKANLHHVRLHPFTELAPPRQSPLFS